MELPDKSNPVPPKKKVEAVVSTPAKEVSRPASRRFFDFVFAESPKQLLKKVARDVLVPRAKAGFEEAAQNFLGGMLWGDSTNRPMSNVVRGTVIRGGAVNYAAISNQQSGMQQARQALPQTAGGPYRDLVFGTIADAERVLAGLYDALNEYRVVAVGDLYELAMLPSTATSISDNALGWTSLDGARITKARDGYCLELPRPSHI